MPYDFDKAIRKRNGNKPSHDSAHFERRRQADRSYGKKDLRLLWRRLQGLYLRGNYEKSRNKRIAV